MRKLFLLSICSVFLTPFDSIKNEPVEADYLEYVSQNDPYEKIQTLENPENLVKYYIHLLKKKREQVHALLQDIDKEKELYFLVPLTPSDPKIFTIISYLTSVDRTLTLLEKNFLFFPMELGVIEEFQEIRPILIEYRIKSFLAKNQDERINLEINKLKKIATILDYKFDKPPQEGDFMSFAFYNLELEFALEGIGDSFSYLLELINEKKGKNKAEKAILPILIKHKKTFDKAWCEEINNLRFCYVTMGSDPLVW